jgi:hypothetical protein
MTTFSTFSELISKTTNQRIYIELSNGYYVSVTKMQLKRTASGMANNDDKFCGEIFEHSKDCVKVSLNKIPCPVS